MKIKKERVERLALSVVFALVLMVGLVMGMRGDPQLVEAGPEAASAYPITINTAGIAANTTWTAKQWSSTGDSWTKAEIWYSIDQGTVNTITIYLDVSPDNSVWKTGQATVVSANAADAVGYSDQTIAGRYFRLRATVANTNTVTPTLKVVYH